MTENEVYYNVRLLRNPAIFIPMKNARYINTAVSGGPAVWFIVPGQRVGFSPTQFALILSGLASDRRIKAFRMLFRG